MTKRGRRLSEAGRTYWEACLEEAMLLRYILALSTTVFIRAYRGTRKNKAEVEGVLKREWLNDNTEDERYQPMADLQACKCSGRIVIITRREKNAEIETEVGNK